MLLHKKQKQRMKRNQRKKRFQNQRKKHQHQKRSQHMKQSKTQKMKSFLVMKHLRKVILKKLLSTMMQPLRLIQLMFFIIQTNHQLYQSKRSIKKLSMFAKKLLKSVVKTKHLMNISHVHTKRFPQTMLFLASFKKLLMP